MAARKPGKEREEQQEQERRERKKPGPKPGPKRVALYIEVPEEVREAMERLAQASRRSLTSECIVGLEFYIASKNGDGGDA